MQELASDLEASNFHQTDKEQCYIAPIRNAHVKSLQSLTSESMRKQANFERLSEQLSQLELTVTQIIQASGSDQYILETPSSL
jgi:hypothetical protein